MSTRFNAQLAREMERRGRTVNCASYGEASGAVELVSLDGGENVTFYYDPSAAGNGRVEFLGMSAAPHKRTGLFNTERAAERILSYEASTAEEREKSKVRRAERQAHEKRRKTAEELNAPLAGKNVQLSTESYWESTDTSFQVRITGMDAGQAAMLVDFLQDNGYIKDLPKTDE